MTTHTPGPWFAEQQLHEHTGESLGWIINFDGGRIGWSSYATAKPYERESAPHPIGGANARLIAAAPELLEACQYAGEVIESLDGISRNNAEQLLAESLDKLHAAIAKATGARP